MCERVGASPEVAAVAALYEFAQKHWGWGSVEYESVRDAVDVVLAALAAHPDAERAPQEER